MNHGLLVSSLVVRHECRIRLRELLERLTDASYVSVSENSKHSLNGALSVLTVNRVLVRQKFDDCLTHGHSSSAHGFLSET
jgi:hypothetical protein